MLTANKFAVNICTIWEVNLINLLNIAKTQEIQINFNKERMLTKTSIIFCDLQQWDDKEKLICIWKIND